MKLLIITTLILLSTAFASWKITWYPPDSNFAKKVWTSVSEYFTPMNGNYIKFVYKGKWVVLFGSIVCEEE